MASISKRVAKDGTPSWLVRIRLTIDGEPYKETKTFRGDRFKQRDARAWAAKREAELLLNGPNGNRAADNKATLESLTKRYLREYESVAKFGRSKSGHLRYTMQYPIAKKRAATLTAGDYLDHVRGRLQEGIKPQTILNDLVWWRVVLKVAKAAWNIPVSIEEIDSATHMARMHGMVKRSGQRVRRPTLDELDRVMSQLARTRGGKIPMLYLVPFQIFSARRIAETTRLMWADYKPESAEVLVRDMKDPRRSDNHVTVGLTTEAMQIIELQPRHSAYIFPYNSRSISDLFRRHCRVAGVDDLHLHDLRHEGASWLFEKGFDIPRVSLITGHRNWASLKRYTHLSKAEPFDKYAGWKWKPRPRSARLQVVQVVQ